MTGGVVCLVTAALTWLVTSAPPAEQSTLEELPSRTPPLDVPRSRT